MTDIAPANLSALIQVQRYASDTQQTRPSSIQADNATEQSKAREAASKFEALLIHNMLKGMRKTTMAENTTNQRALYDDMLDKNLADSMMKAGGLGIADQLMSQLQSKSIPETAQTEPHTGVDKLSSGDRLRLRALALTLNDSPRETVGKNKSTSSITNESIPSETGLARLKLLSRLWGQTESTPPGSALARNEFLESLTPHAQRSAQRLGTSTSAVLAIAALETGWGQFMLKDGTGRSSNNYFGIKADSQDKYYTRNTTTEYLNGTSQNVQAKFKAYDNTADSVEGFADFILENPRYSTALQHASNPERFIRELHDAGYATDPRYADKAITVMRQVEQQNSKP